MHHRIRGRQITEFIQNDRINQGELSGKVSCLAVLFFLVQEIDQIHGIVEANPLALMDGSDTQSGGQMGLAGTGAADEDQVMGGVEVAALSELFDASLFEWAFLPLKTTEIPVHGKACGLELVGQATGLVVGLFGIQQAQQHAFG